MAPMPVDGNFRQVDPLVCRQFDIPPLQDQNL